jgi:hypothetical protein
MAKSAKIPSIKSANTNEKTFRDMAIFEANASLFEKQSTKLSHAIMQVKADEGFKSYKKDVAEYQSIFNKEVEKIRIKFASEDDKGQLMYLDKDKGTYSYTKKNAEEFSEEIHKLNEKYKPKNEELDLKTCIFEPYFSTSIPAGLTLEHYEAFRGIVISEVDYKKFIDELK